MMRRFALIAIVCCLACSGFSQSYNPQVYTTRNALIDTLLEKELFSKALTEVKAQISYLEKTGELDSIYKFVYKIGFCYWKTGDAKRGQTEADKLLQKAMAVDKDTVHLLAALTDLSWLNYETGNDALCLASDEKYLALCLAYSEKTPEQLSNGYYNLGFDYLAVGNGKRSVEFFRKSIDPLLSDSIKYAGDLLKRYNALGSGLYRLGEFARARDAYNKTLFYASHYDDPYDVHSNIANCYGNLSLIAEDEGDYVEAKELLEKSLEHRSIAMTAANAVHLQHQEQDNLIKGYSNLASIYLLIGEYARTEKLLQLAREEKRKLLDADDPRLYLIDESFGSYYLAIGDFEKAKESIERYKNACLANYGENSFWTGFAHKRLGQIYDAMENFEQSIDSYSSAIKTFEASGDEDSSQDLAGAYLDRAKAFSHSNEIQKSNADIYQALKIFGTVRKSYDPAIARCYMALAQNAFNTNDMVEANLLADSALNVLTAFRERAQPQHGRLVQVIPYLPAVYYLKARITSANNTSQESLQKSADYIALAVDELRGTGQALDYNESRLQHYKSFEDVFNYAQNLTQQLFTLTGDQAHLDRMLQFAEENKTVMLRRQLSAFSSVRFADIPDSIVMKENALIRSLQSENIDKDSIQQVLSVEKEFDRLMEVLAAQYPQYYKMRYDDAVASVKEIQTELCTGGKNLIEYMVTDTLVFALVITAEKFSLVTISGSGLSELILQYNDAIVHFDQQKMNALGFALYQRLFAPLEKSLDSKELLIIPDNELFLVNFESLQKEPGGSAKSFLIQDYTISYLLSATTALQFNHLKKNSGKGILALAPGFSDDQKERYSSMAKGLRKYDDSFLKYIQQPFALKSANELVDIIPGMSLTGNNATEANFRSNAGQYGIIHFGTHTEINNDSPLLSRLILTSSGSDSLAYDDGYLHAYEIYDLSLQAELAVLTACQTGSGKQNNSEGIFSLAHSFAYAGCPSVVMSMWQIDEKTSSEIIENFYSKLAKGLSKNEALRQAKLDYIQTHEGEMISPYYWAGMVLMGNTDPMENVASPWKMWLMIAGGVLLIIFMIVFIMRNRKG